MTYEQTFEFSLYGIEIPSNIMFNVPILHLTAQLEAGATLLLKIQITDISENVSQSTANYFVQELYRRLLLTFATNIEKAEPPRTISQAFTTNGTTPVIITRQNITGKASIIKPNIVLSEIDLDVVKREVELRIKTPQPVTSTELYTAIDMYTVGMESQNKVVRFLVFYTALSLAALFKWHEGKQDNVDRLLLERNPQLSTLPKLKKKKNANQNETIYTKLRNDFIHAEERSCDLKKAITTIEANIQQFQRDVSLVFSNL
jgi:hypothetical protein